MTLREHVPLAPLTSLGVGGPARFFVEARTDDEICAAATLTREHSLRFRLLGAGTNVLVPDEGVEALVARIASSSLLFTPQSANTVLAVADAGASWDALVKAAVARGLWGIENLSGIPGTVGGAIVQNVGAYGQAVSDRVAWVETLNLASGVRSRLAPAACAFGYRTSAFKQDRILRPVVRAAFMLSNEPVPEIAYRDLAEHFGERTPSVADVRKAVGAIRAEKFPNLAREGSAGSFFKNIIVSREEVHTLAARFTDMPLFPMPETTGIKVPVAWLLDHALHLKGFSKGPVRLFERQPLVLVAARGSTAAQVEALARAVEERVYDALGITLEREVETFK